MAPPWETRYVVRGVERNAYIIFSGYRFYEISDGYVKFGQQQKTDLLCSDIRKQTKLTLAIIGAGFGRTGTYSLKLALQKLGIGPVHHM